MAHVEIVNASGELEKVYFRFPSCVVALSDPSLSRPQLTSTLSSLSFTPKVLPVAARGVAPGAISRHLPPPQTFSHLVLLEECRQEILWGVDRETPGKQTLELLASTADLHREMRHLERLEALGLWQLLKRHKAAALNSMFFVAVVQNVLLGMRYSTVDERIPHPIEHLGLNVCGVLQVCSCITIFTLYSMQRGVLNVLESWETSAGMPFEEVVARARTEPSWALRLIVFTPYYLLQVCRTAKCCRLPIARLLHSLTFSHLLPPSPPSTQDALLVFYTAAFSAALLGLLVSPLFYCFHLLDMVNKSDSVKSVFRAVTLNGRSILLTALFGACIIWIYAIVGYSFVGDQFVEGDYPDDDLPRCSTLPLCWVAAMTGGLQQGDIGQIMELKPSDDPLYPFLVFYQFSYYLFIVTVLLNVIFGIIIDTFGELRQERGSKKAHMEGTCFICGVDRFTFDSKVPTRWSSPRFPPICTDLH